MSGHIKKASFAGLLIALGIVYGDIGTSPLYTMGAIVRGRPITNELILGSISLIIWTLTLQTTIKYVCITLRADNNGEGGIFSLYALVRKRAKWIVFFAMVGGAALLADGLITPPITVTSSIEGFHFNEDTTIQFVFIILIGIFVMQQFGTHFIGKFFGPVMLLWFLMLLLSGLAHVGDQLVIIKAFNPYYAIKILFDLPGGFWLLGSVFLCTTGAEALYSDLGHVGKANIRISWIFVKSCLIINYLGQGAWLLSNYKGKILPEDVNPFFELMPHQYKNIAIALATLAAIIASQALISGAFTLISEAIKLNLWPKQRIVYPSNEKGQLYIPGINLLLFLGCVYVVELFKKSSEMEGAYGLSITLTMIMTSVLLCVYLFMKKVKVYWIILYAVVYAAIEVSFLVANLDKFEHGGKVTLMIAGIIFYVMYVWFKSRKIKDKNVEFVKLEDYVPIMQELSNDRSIPKYATHLVYMSGAENKFEIEHKVIFSILYNKPKRADIYWFVHVEVTDDPYTKEYAVRTIIPNEIIRIDFRLGFKIEQRIQLLFQKVVDDLVKNMEVNIVSRYDSLSKNNVIGDFRFIVMEKFLSNDSETPILTKWILSSYMMIKKLTLSEERSFGLDPSVVTIEKIPMIVNPVGEVTLKRIGNIQ